MVPVSPDEILDNGVLQSGHDPASQDDPRWQGRCLVDAVD